MWIGYLTFCISQSYRDVLGILLVCLTVLKIIWLNKKIIHCIVGQSNFISFGICCVMEVIHFIWEHCNQGKTNTRWESSIMNLFADYTWNLTHIWVAIRRWRWRQNPVRPAYLPDKRMLKNSIMKSTTANTTEHFTWIIVISKYKIQWCNCSVDTKTINR